MIYPQRATMWHDEILILSGSGPLVSGLDTNQNYATITRMTSHANGDSFTQSFLLDAGTYNFGILGYKDTNMGKLDWYLDGTLFQAADDWYNSAYLYNVFKTYTGIVVASAGRHLLKGISNGKNGSSSNYYIELTKYWFYPSADTTAT